jgi:Tfp pilus assembly protein PilX
VIDRKEHGMKMYRSRRKGMVLAMVVVLMVVISVFFLIAMNLLQTNTKISQAQYEISKAYYLARAGAEMGYGALQADGHEMFYAQKTVAENCVSRKIDPPSTYTTDTLVFDGHDVEVKMRLIRQGSEQILENYFIEIISSATLPDASKTVSILVSVSDINLKWMSG